MASSFRFPGWFARASIRSRVRAGVGWWSLPGLILAISVPASAQCTGDFNQDEVVDGSDLTVLLSGWGQRGASDLNGNGTTDGPDLTLLLSSWGKCDCLAEVCGNGVDDDCDGLVDCADPDCSGSPDCCIDGTSTFPVGTLTLGGGYITNFTFSGVGEPSWVSIAFDYVGNTVGSWASDLVLLIDDGTNPPVYWGGYDTSFYGEVNGGPWPFYGSGSAPSGPYAAMVAVPAGSLALSGSFTIAIGNGWTTSPAVEYQNIEVAMDGLCGEEICSNGIDDDGDGLVDCADPDCKGSPECCIEGTRTFALGDLSLAGNEISNFTYSGSGVPSSVSIAFDYVGNTVGSWASDLVLLIDDGTNPPVYWGGYDTSFYGEVNGGPWPFGGAGSAESGPYAAMVAVPAGSLELSGSFTIGVGNGWATSPVVEYQNIAVAVDGVCWATVLEVAPDPAVIDPEWRDRIIATGLPWRVQDNASGIEMLLVPPGTFMMGCSPSDQYGCYSDEFPVHEVTLTQPLYLGRYEVTQAQWTGVMGSNPSYFQSASAQVPAEQVPNRPVEQVSWNMIQGFEAQTGLRLPTEAEWEYACRAGTPTAFNLPPNGTNADSQLGLLGWYSSNAALQTRPVGQKQANNLGLHDMHGNVFEWAEDWYDPNYYSVSPPVDPPGPTSGSRRVSRGGSWFVDSFYCRASDRISDDPGIVNRNAGFRVARTP